MDRPTEQRVEEIFRVLEEQEKILKHWPYTLEQLKKYKELSARLRQLSDEMCSGKWGMENRI